ncbi:hypothetical protein D3C81_1832340 [compost metagenome]
MNERRVDRIGHVELGAIAMGGDQHAADGIDERADTVAEKLRTHRIAERRQIFSTAKHRQRLLLLHGHPHLLHSGMDVEKP